MVGPGRIAGYGPGVPPVEQQDRRDVGPTRQINRGEPPGCAANAPVHCNPAARPLQTKHQSRKSRPRRPPARTYHGSAGPHLLQRCLRRPGRPSVSVAAFRRLRRQKCAVKAPDDADAPRRALIGGVIGYFVVSGEAIRDRNPVRFRVCPPTVSSSGAAVGERRRYACRRLANFHLVSALAASREETAWHTPGYHVGPRVGLDLPGRRRRLQRRYRGSLGG